MKKFTNWEIFNQLKNVKLTEEIKTKLQQYYEILIEENEKYNLTTIKTIDDVFNKHFLDSMLFTNEFNLSNEKIVDIGTGPGFPGIVLKIFYPDLKLTLVESNNKKVNFLRLVVNQLNLKNVEIIDKRSEEIDSSYYETYDIVISRAVAFLDIILEIGVQLLKVKGYFILLKGPRGLEEVASAKTLAKDLNLKLVNQQIINDVEYGTRINLFYEKIDHTNEKYPRKYAVIKKNSHQSIKKK